MTLLTVLSKRFMFLKVCIMRSASYVALFNTGMILILFLDKLKAYGLNINIGKAIIPLYLVTMFLFALFGYLELKIGLFRHEQLYAGRHHPDLQEIRNDVKAIKEKLL